MEQSPRNIEQKPVPLYKEVPFGEPLPEKPADSSELSDIKDDEKKSGPDKSDSRFYDREDDRFKW